MTTHVHGVLCSGNLVYDTLVSPVEDLHWGATTFVDCIEGHPGGNGANTARVLAKLGIPVRLLGAVGSDHPGRLILDALKHSHVDTSFVDLVDTPTSASVAVVKPSGERKFFHQIGASREAFAKPIEFTPELCQGTTYYHCASMFVLPRFRARGPEPLIHARAAGLKTSFDTNWDPQAGWMQTLAPCLPHLDLLFMNEAEAHMITGVHEPAGVAKIVLAKGLRTLALKLGARGCAIYTQEEEVLCPAFEVEVVDTTGAGDCFAAGFLAATLDGASLAEAGRFANAVAALSVQKVGSVSGVLPKPETERWIKHARTRVLSNA